MQQWYALHTKIIILDDLSQPGLRDLTYEERLERLGLPTLQERERRFHHSAKSDEGNGNNGQG